MNSIKILVSLFLITISLSCNTEDSEFLETKKCRLIKYGYQFTILPTGVDTTYLHEINYIDSKTIVRSNFGSHPTFSRWRLLSKDSVIYDQQNKVTKIYNINTHYSSAPKIESYSEFIYDTFNNRPSKIKETRYQLSNDFSYAVTEDIIYNDDNQIIQTLSIDSGFRINTLTNYSYDGNKNVLKIVDIIERTSFTSPDNVKISKDSIVTTFDNYDDKINPFQGMPFSDLKSASESPNNARLIENIQYVDGEVWSAGRSGREFRYNDMGYPLIGEYNCQ